MSQKRYQHYQAAEGSWFTQIPTHWEMLSSNRVFEQKREPAVADDEQLSVTQKYGVMPQNLFMAMDDRKVTLALAGTDNFKHVDEGDFVISLRSFEGGIELSQYKGCISPAYTCLRARKLIGEGYYKFAMKSKDFISALQSVTQGIRDGKNISYVEFSKLSIPYPPVEEQTTIARFLDRETAKIDALIAEQQRLIELLQEKRQAVISHAVTKGLNPNAPMKDSGVELLGEVPEHWEVKSLRHLCSVGRGASPRPAGDPRYFGGDFIPWVTVAEITKDTKITLDTTSEFLTEEGANNSARFEANTVVYSNSGATLGVPKILAIDCCANDGVVGFRELDSSLERKFLYYFLWQMTDSIREWAKQGQGQPNLNTDIIKGIKIALPPKGEQLAVLQSLEANLSTFDSLINAVLKSQSILGDRRSALISAAVTGQIDVRGLVEAEGSEQ